LAAQTRLAHELDQRPDLYDVSFVKLLTLFGDKGIAIQNVVTSDRHVKISLLTYCSIVLNVPFRWRR
jgi:phosphatidylinositol 4-kinase